MNTSLLNYGISSVWCNPNQDNQLIFSPKRISDPIGARNYFKYLERTFSLPVKNKVYHVYNVGQISPALIGLLSNKPKWANERWVSLSEAVNSLKLFCDVYVSRGLEIPRFKTHYMFTNDKTLLIAIEEDSKIAINYKNETIYFRLYSNAYFQTLRADASTEFLYTKGMKINNSEELLLLQAECESYRNKQGYVYSYVNGFLVNAINMVTCKVGDTVEFIYDSSIVRVVDIAIEDLKKFHSELDNKYKYLLTYDQSGVERIEYHDDIDIYIYQENNPGVYKGLYFCRNSPESHRMVTHRDYSITVDAVTYVAGSLSDLLSQVPLDVMKMKVQIRIRDSGWDRPLIKDNNRIFELYKLDFEERLKVMLSIDSNIDIWKASNLENSAYCKLMSADIRDINQAMVNKALGYNASAKYLGDTPSRTTTNGSYKTVELQNLLSERSTVYEYDQNGKLIGYYYNDTGGTYICNNFTTKYVEVISGIATNKPDCFFGNDHLPIREGYSFRLYKCEIVNGIPNENWKDITDTDDYIVDGDNFIVWNNPNIADQYLMVRFDSKFLGYDLSIIPVEGDFKFTLAELEDRNGEDENYIMPVPMGDLDIFLNGASLIPGIDYIINFPEVHILNKSHLRQPAFSVTQKVHVRFVGFCDSELKMDPVENVGFIEHGFLSNNGRFDVRDDKVLRITVNGSIKDRNDVLFSEEHQGVSIVNSVNGKPYQIKDSIVPIKGYTGIDNYKFRSLSLASDKTVSDYLSLKLPQPPRNGLSSITSLYPLISPLLCTLSYDLASNKLDKTMFTDKKLSDVEILNIVRPYENLLDYELGYNSNVLDRNYVVIHPHNLTSTLTITVGQFWFLESVVRLYFDGNVDIHPFFTINGL